MQKIKSFSYTPQQIEMKGDGIKEFFKGVCNKVLKTVEEIIANPGRFLQVATQLGAAAASKNPKAIMSAGMQAGNICITGKGVKIGDLTTGGLLYLYR